MDIPVRDLIIGVIGSLIGALLISLFSFGFRFTKVSRTNWRLRREREFSDWKAGDALKRQRIFNFYLFSVLKLFIIGSIFLGVATAASDLYANNPSAPLNSLDFLFAALDGTGVLFYLATFSQILMFTKLLKLDP